MGISTRSSRCLLLTLAICNAATCWADDASAPPEGPQFTAEGKLVRPSNYREWINVASGLNMSYGPANSRRRNSEPPFTNVFVNPASYRAFLESGTWPDRTMFVLEIRASVPVNKAQNGGNGYFQGELLALEAEVKDVERFDRANGGWAFFDLPSSEAAGGKLPGEASCYGCHIKNAAVDNTFVQFYPVLRDIARQKGTLKDVPEVF